MAAASAAPAASAIERAASGLLGVGFDRSVQFVASMTRGDWLAIALAAVLFFWALGAYNRLVALRRTVADAWLPVADALHHRQEAAQALLAALHEPLAAEHGALDTLTQALAASAATSAALGARPLLPQHAAAWLAAEAAFGAASARVIALAEATGAGDGACGAWAEPLAAFHDGEKRLPFVRQFFNDAAAAHDRALALFPTSLAAWLFGFGPAGHI